MNNVGSDEDKPDTENMIRVTKRVVFNQSLQSKE